MCHLPDRVIGPLFPTQGIVILELESSQILQLDFHVGMQVSKIEPSINDLSETIKCFCSILSETEKSFRANLSGIVNLSQFN